MDRTGMFDLADVIPVWSGWRADFVRPLLKSGLEKLRQRLAGSAVILVEYLVQADYDWQWDKIGLIETCPGVDQATAMLPARSSEIIAREMAAHPSWILCKPPAYDADIAPERGSKVRVRLPPSVFSFAMSAQPLFERLSASYFLLRGEDGDLAGQLTSYRGLQEALLSYLTDRRNNAIDADTTA